jgi:hypothetical protein
MNEEELWQLAALISIYNGKTPAIAMAHADLLCDGFQDRFSFTQEVEEVLTSED